MLGGSCPGQRVGAVGTWDIHTHEHTLPSVRTLIRVVALEIGVPALGLLVLSRLFKPTTLFWSAIAHKSDFCIAAFASAEYPCPDCWRLSTASESGSQWNSAWPALSSEVLCKNRIQKKKNKQQETVVHKTGHDTIEDTSKRTRKTCRHCGEVLTPTECMLSQYTWRHQLHRKSFVDCGGRMKEGGGVNGVCVCSCSCRVVSVFWLGLSGL